MYQPKLAIHATYAKALHDAYGDLVMGSAVPYNVAFKEVALARKPLSHWKPKGAPAKAIDAVADEVLVRVTRLRAGSKEVAA
jgi:chromosome partitioning protein